MQAAGVSLASSGGALDLFNSEIVIPRNASARVRTYSTMLREEMEKRCRVLWRPGQGASRIVLSIAGERDEGFSISYSGQDIRVRGHSERGLLFGIGQLLRKIEFGLQRAVVPLERVTVSSSPKYKLRGHQLGYRPKTNSYDGWDVTDWHQYIRDLAVFGANTIEILPPHTDDDLSSPHFPLPPDQMMVEVSRIADRYGLDVWMWMPVMKGDDWGAIFEKLPRLDAVFTPGGDPGDMAPRSLLTFLKVQKQVLRRTHPRAQMWVSPQSFGEKQLEAFYREVNAAEWLDGVVHGPQCRDSLPELRSKVRRNLPVRLYPDITHSLQCQFPVRDWPAEYAFTEGRECVNPRPRDFAAIAKQYLPDSVGFISYSEGCNDDVNKCVWSAAAWEPNFDVVRCLEEYARYFIGVPEFAAGLFALEQNWVEPQRSAETLAEFQKMEKAASPTMLRNWRFQQGLYRAYFDAYSHTRNPVLRERILELGEALFQSIHMQLNVERYKAEAVARGANLDTLDADISMPPVREVGAGSFYDDLGDVKNRPHLVQAALSEPDPEFRQSVLIGFLYPDSLGEQYPLTWKRWGETLFDTPLKLRYPNLDIEASYKIRVVYSGDAHNIRVRLTANNLEIHPLMEKPWPPKPLEFSVPHEVTSTGTVTLSWTRELGLGGGGRGCQISEVWLIRQ